MKRDCNPTLRTGEISRLLAAAVINQQFRALLLTNPAVAIERGFNGEMFQLEANDLRFIKEIKAKSLPEFAQQLNLYLEMEALLPEESPIMVIPTKTDVVFYVET